MVQLTAHMHGARNCRENASLSPSIYPWLTLDDVSTLSYKETAPKVFGALVSSDIDKTISDLATRGGAQPLRYDVYKWSSRRY